MAIELDKDVPSQVDADLMTQYSENFVGNMPGLKSLVFSTGQVFGAVRYPTSWLVITPKN